MNFTEEKLAGLTGDQEKGYGLMCQGHKVFTVKGYAGTGKAQPNDTVIPSPRGEKKLGDILVGDVIFDKNGEETLVTGVFPQGVIDKYMIVFSDNRVSYCNDSHLWTYITSKGNFKTKQLKDLMDFKTIDNRGRYNYKYKIPINGPVKFKKIGAIKVDPYVFGCFIGDGCLRQRYLTMSSQDEEIIVRIANTLNLDYRKCPSDNHNWNFYKNGKVVNTSSIFCEDTLINKYSYEKHIPDEYATSSIKNRFDLLAGILDTDGSVSKVKGRVSFCTTSKLLAKDVMNIVFSLGMSARITEDIRHEKYTTGHCYTVRISCSVENKIKLFKLNRKIRRIIEYIDSGTEFHRHESIRITDIKRCGRSEMTCISVDNSEQLYLTNDYIVTHNTFLVDYFIKNSGITNVSVCAPTHKAVGVANGDCTIHSLLGLKIKGVEDKQVLHKVGFSENISYGQTVVIDEASMISKDLLNYIHDAQETHDINVIFIGDECFSKGTMVLMYNGDIKEIENIEIGDLVMGVDSRPRTVLRKCNGITQLYDVKQYGGTTYTVTQNHKIAYKRRSGRKTDGFKDSLSEDNDNRGVHRRNLAIDPSNNYRYPSYGDYPLITAEEAEKLSNKFSEIFGGYGVCVEFPEKDISIDPYYLGQWLGDGDNYGMRLSTEDIEVVDFCKKYAKSFDLLTCHSKWYNNKNYFRVSITTGSNGGSAKNELMEMFRKYNLIVLAGEDRKICLKHIPNDFLINSRENRLNLLAGLIDSDGSYDKTGSRYTFANTNKQLIDDVERLVYGLGFRCSKNVNSSDKCIFYGKEYSKKTSITLVITGDIHKIPCKIKRKISTKPKRSKDVVKIYVSKANIGEYFGIEVSDDNLFLLNDCTVVSNCQIPPVGESISPVWKLDNPGFMLTEIVRQARDSGIISLATAIRDGSAFKTGISKYINGTDVLSGGIREMREFYYRCVEEGSFPHIISYRNAVVNNSNIWGRKIVMDNPKEEYLPGEEVYVRSVGEDQIHNLEDIVLINSVSDPYKYTERNVHYAMHVLDVEIESPKGRETFTIPASAADIKSFTRNKSDIARDARSKRCTWGKFWKFSNSISELKHIYALTAHRAQGSTFENVIVNCNDIGKNQKLLYTAVTRAAKKVFLFRQ